jgi:hypothetical protein
VQGARSWRLAARVRADQAGLVLYHAQMVDVAERAGELRRRLVAKIPPSYNPWLHLAATTGVGLGAIALGAAAVKALRPVELLIVPATMIAANAFEWRVHKDVLHRRFWPLGEIFERHTPQHHGVYHTGTMAMRDWKEMRMVLIPAAGVLGIVAATAPAAAAIGALLSPNAGWLFLATSASYMVSYELLHLSYHLPEDHPIARTPLIAWLRRHHAVHHDPRNMQRWNFNVTVPFWDWVKDTMAPGAGAEAGATSAAT